MADENKAGQQLIFVGHKKLMKISYFRRRATDVNKPYFRPNFFVGQLPTKISGNIFVGNENGLDTCSVRRLTDVVGHSYGKERSQALVESTR